MEGDGEGVVGRWWMEECDVMADWGNFGNLARYLHIKSGRVVLGNSPANG